MNAEHAQPVITREELGRAVLRFIAQTSRFEAEFKRRRDQGEMSHADLLRVAVTVGEQPAAVIGRSRQVINECLGMIGGIATSIDDAATGASLPCRLVEWQGNHPLLDGQHLWRAEFPQKGRHEVTMNSTAIDELMAELAEGTHDETLALPVSNGEATTAPEWRSPGSYL